MRVRTTPIALTGLLVLALGCSKASKDTSPVIVNVGGEKITEQAFKAMVHAMANDKAKAEAFLTEEGQRDQRNGFLGKMAQAKQVVLMGKAAGLDKDPAVQAQLEGMMAQTYMQVLADRRLGKAEPGEAELKGLYDTLIAERKAAGQADGLPAFEQVKAQLPMIWKQRQQEKVLDQLLKEAREKAPATFAEAYRPADAK